MYLFDFKNNCPFKPERKSMSFPFADVADEADRRGGSAPPH